MTMHAPTPPYLKTMTECHQHLMKEGFKEDFSVENNVLKAPGSGKIYTPEQTKITNFFRFEGESNPDDSAILYAIETSDGTKGTLVDAYGPYADPEKAAFIQAVKHIQKKTNKE